MAKSLTPGPNAFQREFGSVNSLGYQQLGTICKRMIYEGPQGDEEPFYIDTKHDLNNFGYDYNIFRSDTPGKYFILSPFWDIDDPEEWNAWINRIRQIETHIEETYHNSTQLGE